MKALSTRALLLAVCVLLVAHLVRATLLPAAAEAANNAPAPEIIRAQSIELVNKQGQAVAQLFVGDDGGGNIRLRSADGMVRAKFGATDDGAGLLLFDAEAEPAVWMLADKSGTTVTLAEKGKDKRVIKP